MEIMKKLLISVSIPIFILFFITMSKSDPTQLGNHIVNISTVSDFVSIYEPKNNASLSVWNYTYLSLSNYDNIFWIEVPKHSIVERAELNLTGFPSARLIKNGIPLGVREEWGVISDSTSSTDYTLLEKGWLWNKESIYNPRYAIYVVELWNDNDTATTWFKFNISGCQNYSEVYHTGSTKAIKYGVVDLTSCTQDLHVMYLYGKVSNGTGHYNIEVYGVGAGMQALGGELINHTTSEGYYGPQTIESLTFVFNSTYGIRPDELFFVSRLYQNTRVKVSIDCPGTPTLTLSNGGDEPDIFYGYLDVSSCQEDTLYTLDIDLEGISTSGPLPRIDYWEIFTIGNYNTGLGRLVYWGGTNRAVGTSETEYIPVISGTLFLDKYLYKPDFITYYVKIWNTVNTGTTYVKVSIEGDNCTVSNSSSTTGTVGEFVSNFLDVSSCPDGLYQLKVYLKATEGEAWLQHLFIFLANKTAFIGDDLCEGYYENALDSQDCVNNTYPQNVYIDTANDGIKDYSISELNKTVRIDLNTTAFNQYLSSCSEDKCDVPITLSSFGGIVQVSSLNVTYNYNISRLFSAQCSYYVESGKNISRTCIVKPTSEDSDVDLSLLGYYTNHLGADPNICEINGSEVQLYSDASSNLYCYYPFSISTGSSWETHNITWYKNAFITETISDYTILNDTIIVDDYVVATYNVSGTNTDSVGYENVYIVADIPNQTIYSNITPYTFITNLTAGESYLFSVNISGIPVRETEWGLSTHAYPNIYKHIYTATVNVVDAKASEKEIYYYVNVSRLTNWNSRDTSLDEFYVDNTSTGFNVNVTPDYVIFNIPTTFSNSSLDYGSHTFQIIYQVPYTQPSGGATGGGGGLPPPVAGRLLYEPKNLTIDIYYPKRCNSTLINLTWLSENDVNAYIIVSEDLKNILVQPKDGDRILLKGYETTYLPVEACISLYQKPELLRGYSGYIEIKITTPGGGIVSTKVPVEIRVYKTPELPPPKPTPAPKPIYFPRKFIIIILLILLGLGIILV